ncbi:DUF559 domain-containing protein [Nocardia sp. NPDC058666]|uniref:DUF559 domain-containing protein n=1 Tax=Nocardia sp. NPDC058666 TaxID=3346587 RepID=UPI00366078CE
MDDYAGPMLPSPVARSTEGKAAGTGAAWTVIHSLKVIHRGGCERGIGLSRRRRMPGMDRIVTRAQLAAEGVASSTIGDRCRRGRYVRLLPGVFCEGTPTTLARCAAIVEWLPDAHLSHRTAAWLWAMLPEPQIFEATVPVARRRQTPSWLRLYRRDLPADAKDDLAQLPVTTAAQTVLDCLTVLPTPEADALIDEQICRTVDPTELTGLCETRRHGVPVLRRQLQQAALRPMSEPERLFARALARRNLPLAANEPVGPYTCDFVDHRGRTVVEIDGWEFHRDKVNFRHDRLRQNWLVIHGWFVLRYSAHDVLRNLDHCVDEVVDVVRRRRSGRGLA